VARWPRVGLTSKRLKGFEPSTFCMAITARQKALGPANPAKKNAGRSSGSAE
jgi:hypothetical protein